MHLSNCVIEALRHYWRLQRQGQRVVLTWRPTDWDARHSHMGWAVYDPARQVYVPYSFKPVAPRHAPWYLIWTRLLFRGHIVAGDDPPPATASTQQPPHV